MPHLTKNAHIYQHLRQWDNYYCLPLGQWCRSERDSDGVGTWWRRLRICFWLIGGHARQVLWRGRRPTAGCGDSGADMAGVRMTTCRGGKVFILSVLRPSKNTKKDIIISPCSKHFIYIIPSSLCVLFKFCCCPQIHVGTRFCPPTIPRLQPPHSTVQASHHPIKESDPPSIAVGVPCCCVWRRPSSRPTQVNSPLPSSPPHLHHW